MGIITEIKNRLESYIEAENKNNNLDPNDRYFDIKIKNIGNRYEDMYSKPDGYKSPLDKPYKYEERMKELEKKEGRSSGDKESSNNAEKYMNMFVKNHRPETDVLFKSEDKITEGEIMAAKKFSYYDNNDENLKQTLNNKISAWYDKTYSTNPIKTDAAGRQISSSSAIVPDEISPANTREGIDLNQGLNNLSHYMAKIDNDDTPERGVSALQKSLNRLGISPSLKEDGELGPKTALQTRLFMVGNGYNSLEKALKNKIYTKS